ncbi:hypothetical protein ACFYM5_11225 [Streptomyces sp. NPDC006706]|uniref:hypothetical protein n=1 Tax=Streptomyces sp. NPDC006706 TaxID=3364761 RepID=UPI00369652FC
MVESIWTSQSDPYRKTGGGTTTARFGWNRGTAHTGSWFSQSSGITRSSSWSNQTINTCDSVIGWSELSCQQTFN